MIAAPNDTALATRLQLFCGTLDTRVTSPFLLFKKYRYGLTPRAVFFFYQTALDWQSRNSLERRDNAWHLGSLRYVRLHALDNPRNAPVAAVGLREVTLQSRPLPGVGERDRALSRPPKERNINVPALDGRVTQVWSSHEQPEVPTRHLGIVVKQISLSLCLTYNSSLITLLMLFTGDYLNCRIISSYRTAFRSCNQGDMNEAAKTHIRFRNRSVQFSPRSDNKRKNTA
ncbi:hypothetical protein ALC56_14391 [Trachymyrmex septentrionalis]|uniref:Uncharacterized protein n=1 Tax=Trachymyrmex septentrionalis TaxID=34720 RepID=A0A195ETD2_9HYME|nr:hypothetical protein ALC56_14391 [Trachymyrmex septentrionalis]